MDDARTTASARRSNDDGMQDVLSNAIRAGRAARGGKVSSYIPQLAAADPHHMAGAVCCVDGTVVVAGDAGVRFSIQSICKPYLYGLALARFGFDRVHTRVGVEPTGQEFNSFTRLESGANRPANPMINAGAIAMTDFLMSGAGGSAEAAKGIILSLSRFAGKEEMAYDPAVFESERGHATRNRVIAHLMRHFDLITNEVEEILDCYFRICALEVTCRDLAVMAACLAHGGINPVTNERVLTPAITSTVLSVMSTCGMYDRSGAFAYEVGLPAKSGVSGGVIAVVPSRYGLAVYSPRVDAAGNSVPGWAVLRSVARYSGAHFMRAFSVGRRRPAASRITEALSRTHERSLEESGGEAAPYLPQVEGSPFAIAVSTVNGFEHAVGDADRAFTLQAIANPLAYGAALMRLGRRAVRRCVGVEPSGNPFHAILIDRRNGRPYNPLGNAGAIAVASLNAGDPRDPLSALRNIVQDLAGADAALPVDQEVLSAERANGHRNRAIAHLLVEVGDLTNVGEALELYFQSCAIAATSRELARIGCALANGGVQPVTDKRVFSADVTRSILTVMFTCGMHDQSGRFAVDVGLPAKSGISGGILAIVPGVMGIAVYSPAVDSSGTSVRGRMALAELAHGLGLSVFGTCVEAVARRARGS